MAIQPYMPFQMPGGPDFGAPIGGVPSAGQPSEDPQQKAMDAAMNYVPSGRNPAAAGLKQLAPLDYALLAHQYDLYSQLQPEHQDAIRQTMQLLQDPEAMSHALRSGLLSSVPDAAGTAIAGLQAYGAGDSAKQGAYLNATNQANETANAAEAQAASPGGKLARLQAMGQVMQQAAPDISRSLAMSQNFGPTQSGPGFLGGLVGGLTSMIPSIGGLGKMVGGLSGASSGPQTGPPPPGGTQGGMYPGGL